jgi:hypothetical protein
MNEEALNDILRGIQSSRPMASKILYGGDLQDNTDQYFRPSPFHNEDSVPKAPANLFCEYGATAEVDKRPFMTPQPQVPRDPELEGLNEYFNKQRVLSYARGVSGMVISEVLAKQAEQVANSYVKDEIDRRSGIRKSVLMGSGVPEADATRQIATEALAGINPRTMDMRDKQITDAVNMYYRINNLPTPVTQPAPNAIPATLPSGVEQAIPQEEAELGESANADMYDDMPALEAEVSSSADRETGDEGGFGISAAEGVPRGILAAEGPRGILAAEGAGGSGTQISDMSKLQCVVYIRANNVLTPATSSMRTGALLSDSGLLQLSKDELQEIVREHMVGQRRTFPEF